MKQYRVKVTEVHTDYVWVMADDPDDAMQIAPDLAHCELERTICEIAPTPEEGQQGGEER